MDIKDNLTMLKTRSTYILYICVSAQFIKSFLYVTVIKENVRCLPELLKVDCLILSYAHCKCSS